jgi:hypothetical protein
MSQRWSSSIIFAVLFALACVSANGQGRRGSTPAGKPRQDVAQPRPTPQPTPDSFWAAQRSIEAAIQQLEAYLSEYPDGERAVTARQQVEALRGLSVSASRPAWVKMGPKYQRHMPVWRVASVDLQPDRVALTVEIACERDDGGDCYFDPFDRSPLVLIDNAGHYYPMLKAGDLPPDVRLKDGMATISGGRSISVKPDFGPPPVGAVSGQIYYRDNNRAEPARFSLTHRR